MNVSLVDDLLTAGQHAAMLLMKRGMGCSAKTFVEGITACLAAVAAVAAASRGGAAGMGASKASVGGGGGGGWFAGVDAQETARFRSQADHIKLMERQRDALIYFIRKEKYSKAYVKRSVSSSSQSSIPSLFLQHIPRVRVRVFASPLAHER